MVASRGYQEVISYAFVDPQLQGRMFPQLTPVALANPISADLAAMRVSLWPGLIKAAQDNLRRQQSRVRLFERGAVFLRNGSGVTETPRVAGVAVGPRMPEQWGQGKDAVDFFDLKSDVMAVLALSGESVAFEFQPTDLSVPASRTQRRRDPRRRRGRLAGRAAPLDCLGSGHFRRLPAV